jgi:hypothetical protein
MPRGGEVSEDLFERGLCLPSGTQLTEEDLERVVDVLRRCCKLSGFENYCPAPMEKKQTRRHESTGAGNCRRVSQIPP